MLIVIAKKLPPAVRGKMKAWFVEPKANVFISSVSDNLALRVASSLMDYCDDDSGIFIAASTKNFPGYKIFQKGAGVVNIVNMSGIQLVKE